MSLDYMKPNKSQDTCFCKGLRWIKQLKRDEFSLKQRNMADVDDFSLAFGCRKDVVRDLSG